MAAMEILTALHAAIKVYSIYEEISNIFIDEVANILQVIAEKECKSAIKTLQDSKYSNDKRRELESAITQLRLAIEKADSLGLKCKISAIIALCYKVLNEDALMSIFKQNSIDYFTKYTNEYLVSIERLVSTRERVRMFTIPGIAIPGVGGVIAVGGEIVTYRIIMGRYESLASYIKSMGINVADMADVEFTGSRFVDSHVDSLKEYLDMFYKAEIRAKNLVTQSQKQFVIYINNILST